MQEIHLIRRKLTILGCCQKQRAPNLRSLGFRARSTSALVCIQFDTSFGSQWRPVSNIKLRNVMISDSEKVIFAKLAALDSEVVTLREGYLVLNKRYSEALASMKALTAHTLEAAIRAAIAAEKSALACKNASAAAMLAADIPMIEAVDAAAASAGLAALAASEAAAAASAAAAAAASVAAFQAEETALQASAEAASATTRATAAAADAVKMANEAAEFARSLKKQT